VITIARYTIMDALAVAWRAARPWLAAVLFLATWPLSVIAIVARDMLEAQHRQRPMLPPPRVELPRARMVRR